MANESCCFAQRTETLFPDKPVDGQHYVEYSDMDEFREKIFYYLSRKEECKKIGENGRKFVKEFHSGRARFDYIIRHLTSGIRK